MMVPLFKPFVGYSEDKLNALLHSGKLAYGKYGYELEKKLESFLGAKNVIYFNTYNSAWQALIKSISNDISNVIAPSFACAASIQPFNTENLPIQWMDVDAKTGQCIPPTKKDLSSNTLVSVGHNCGYLSDVDAFEDLRRATGCTVVHDCIEAFGSKWDDYYIGSSSIVEIAVFSADTVRMLNSITGGFIACKCDSLATRIRLIRDYGIERKYYRDVVGEIDFEYDIALPGYGSKPSEVNSFIGLENLSHIDEILNLHKKNAKNWLTKLRDFNLSLEPIPVAPRSSPNYWVLGVASKDKRADITKLKGLGYVASGIHAPISNNSAFGNKQKLIGSMRFNELFLGLPTGWWCDI